MKKAIYRGLYGIPVGIAISYLITVVLSLFWGEGQYAPCVPAFTRAVGSEAVAVALQAASSGLLGFAFGAASVIWEQENWSLALQTALHFAVLSCAMLPMAYCFYWMEHSVLGFLQYFGIFAGIFFLIWLVQYFRIRQNIKNMNKKLK